MKINSLLLFGSIFFYSLNVGSISYALYTQQKEEVPLVDVVLNNSDLPVLTNNDVTYTFENSLLRVEVSRENLTSLSESSPAGVLSASVEEVHNIIEASATAKPSVRTTPQSSPSPKLALKTQPRKLSAINSASPSSKVKAQSSLRASASATPKIIHQRIVTTPTSSPAVLLSPTLTSSLDGGLLFSIVNNHRVKIGKPALEKNDLVCSWTQQRAPQISKELYGGTLHAGFRAMNLPYWASENIASYQSEQAILNWWLSDYIHKKAIEGDYKYSCASCSGRSCSQIFTNFVKK